MEVDCIPFRQTGFFSELICDYLDEKDELKPFYNRYPKLENFEAQITEKKNKYNHAYRSILHRSLLKQYEGLSMSKLTKSNIDSLLDENTFTVVTGHQLNLFTGPLYFLYKIVSTINLAKKLKQHYPKNNFVPVYWMATEDHDFEEINYFNLRGKKVQWNKPNAGGPVGRFDLAGLDEVFHVVASEWGNTELAKKLKNVFTSAYLNQKNLADATRFLANELFAEYGLVIVDGDDFQLKELLIPYAKKDIFEERSFKNVSKTIEALKAISPKYSVQVNPREINYFYIRDGLRERIIERNSEYTVNGTELTFSKEELEDEMANHPERFSPNVITRPLYQEVVLPNLCYIGGGGELAYWLELKSSFDAKEVVFPMLLLRNSVLSITEKQNSKLNKLDISIADLFLDRNQLINKKIRSISNIEIDLSPQKKYLEEQFASLHELAEQTDKTFLNAVKAQERKQKNGLEKLERRLLKAQKRKLKDHVVRLTDLHNWLFPNGSLQERQLNFSELYLEFGNELIQELIKHLEPLKDDFLILRY